MDAFFQYFNKILSLFDKTKPKHGRLLRRALLTFGDYTLPVGAYKTFCVDDPNEAASTPSLKRLFSNHGSIVKQLLDLLDLSVDIEIQLKSMVKKSTISSKDWRYCFIKYPGIFAQMSVSHLRLREVSGEMLIIPNKSSNGYNYDVFLLALYAALKVQGIEASFGGELGTWADRYIGVKGFYVRFKKGKFIIKDETNTVVFETISDEPLGEAEKFAII